MRRRIVSVLVMLLGLLGFLAGVAMAVLLGPDNRLTTGPHDMSTDQMALVSSPQVLRWAGPTVTVTAELPDDQPVFLGLGNTVDVADFFSQSGFERVDSLDLPWEVATTTVSGKPYVPAAPMAADWWIAQNAGQGGAQITVPLPDQSSSLVVVALDGDLQDLQISGSYFLAGGFGIGLGLAGLSLGLALFGWLALRTARARPAAEPVAPVSRRRPAAAPGGRPAGSPPRSRPTTGLAGRPASRPARRGAAARARPRPASEASSAPEGRSASGARSASKGSATDAPRGERVRVPRPRPAGGQPTGESGAAAAAPSRRTRPAGGERPRPPAGHQPSDDRSGGGEA